MTHGLARLRGRTHDKGFQSDCDDEQAEHNIFDRSEIGMDWKYKMIAVDDMMALLMPLKLVIVQFVAGDSNKVVTSRQSHTKVQARCLTTTRTRVNLVGKAISETRFSLTDFRL